MVQVTVPNVRFAGLASCVPRQQIRNSVDCPPSQRAERARFVRNVGIDTRRMCPPWMCFSDLAEAAAARLLDELGWARDSIDALIVLTQSPDYLIPSTAIIVQHRLQLPTRAVAYDVNLGCSSYPFGLHLIATMMQGGGVRRALMLVGDRCATLNDGLFSDAGTATALEFDEAAKPMHFDLNSDGSGHRAIMLPVGGHREPFELRHHIPVVDEHGQRHYASDLILDGPAVLNFALQRVPETVAATLAYANASLDDVDHLVLHQANRMINETLRKKLRLPAERVPSTLDVLGNTSGASLPVTVTVRVRDALAAGAGARMLLCGFGIGLSWGCCLLDADGAVLPELLELQ